MTEVETFYDKFQKDLADGTIEISYPNKTDCVIRLNKKKPKYF